MIRKILFAAFLISSLSCIAQGSIKTMFYNLFDSSEFLSVDRVPFLRDILNEYELTIFIVCELETNKVIVLSGTEFDNIQPLIVTNNTNVQDGLHIRVEPEAGIISINLHNAIGQLMMKIDSNNSEAIVSNISQFSDDIYYLTRTSFNGEPLKFLKTS